MGLPDNGTNYVLVKTVLGMERLVASYVKELDPEAKVEPSPLGFKGLVLVATARNGHALAAEIGAKIPEAEKVLPVDAVVPAALDAMAEAVRALVKGKISGNETFAVRTVRRGTHNFTSIDVNVVVGDVVRRVTGATVNLNAPDKIVRVEIVGNRAFIAVRPGSEEYRKMRPGKVPLYKLFRRLSVVHMPYLGPTDAAYKMGERVGRELQTFEVGELVIAPIGLVKADELQVFVKGVLDGIESRYAVQVRSYGRAVHKVRVYIQDLYQLVRDRSNEVIIVFEPEGAPVSKVTEELYELIVKKGRRVNLLFGSREGIPVGIYRFADIVVDVAPGITIATDYAAASALIAIGTLLHDKLR
ncbi:TPA: RNA-binding protein, partial [Candidatus Micrarchaeota archaeon]|nr:RNA-binding protein [Candidatus Micrarchaeota archaeon]